MIRDRLVIMMSGGGEKLKGCQIISFFPYRLLYKGLSLICHLQSKNRYGEALRTLCLIQRLQLVGRARDEEEALFLLKKEGE